MDINYRVQREVQRVEQVVEQVVEQPMERISFVTSASRLSLLSRLQLVVQRVVQDVVHLIVHPVVEQPTDFACLSVSIAPAWLSRCTVSASDSLTSIFPSLSYDRLAVENANSFAFEKEAEAITIIAILSRYFIFGGWEMLDLH
jgi:hypothetical protein